VSASQHDLEVARANALQEQLDQRESELRDLQKSQEILELERGSLSEERVALINDLEDLRLGNEAVLREVEHERRVRQEREAEIAELSGTYLSLVEQLEEEVESGQLEIHRLRGRLQVRALDRILFDSGSTSIKGEGQEVLSKVAAQLKDIPRHRISVEGHTDNMPIATAQFPSNWELSAARASRVVRLLIQQGLDPSKLSAVGFGPEQPIADNATREGRSRNRRIELVLVPDAAD
jgi:chemotaxis protein MotB